MADTSLNGGVGRVLVSLSSVLVAARVFFRYQGRPGPANGFDREAPQYHNFGCTRVSGHRSWIGPGRRRSTAVNDGVAWVRDEPSPRERPCVRRATFVRAWISSNTTQAPDLRDILNVVDSSETVFQVVLAFFIADLSRLVAEIVTFEASFVGEA